MLIQLEGRLRRSPPVKSAEQLTRRGVKGGLWSGHQQALGAGQQPAPCWVYFLLYRFPKGLLMIES
jgi:hypothetical protein